MENAPCLGCKHTYFEGGGFGLEVCLACGLARTSVQTRFSNEFSTHERLHGQQSYTRLKRFKKYLCRAMRQQSSATVPKETWDYLVERGPYHGPRHVHQVLKKARLKRKCYDSLPFLTAALCPQLELPQLSQHEKFRAIALFKKIDAAVKDGPFISYMFCLEYILRHIGREDLCDYINKIQCSRRRHDYTRRLDKIFSQPVPNIMFQLQKSV